ncbi:hypothetical protein O7614_05215 [Micromonospora sp. WMMD961]|uniref:hypothetical protein n=1 Tax=Micromonospora sp. WMMD961 TaxID=3016100 RepID=UPI002417BF6C|nr:hypothetical protein [Micromonospora sp. WMMD961]MDG4779045.1 hypothetical protein [Micromonospora sp. WMMD961]
MPATVGGREFLELGQHVALRGGEIFTVGRLAELAKEATARAVLIHVRDAWAGK